ncbi:MAG: metallophosphoesterase [Firmicutes bacterium HGW-Firmicutes-14]|nr:MAG: metallophosphoesterase [Firmicutes bacterium HGW-Firmicutes-14]
MRIGVVSDTHGKPEFFRRAVEQMGKIDLLIHAGDHYKDALSIGKEAGLKVVAVGGNCDWFSPGPDEEELEIEGYRILVTHGHMYGVKAGTSRLAEKLREGKYDLVVYGHSHVPEITRLQAGYLMNPGSVSSPRMGCKRTYGIVEIDKNGLIPHIRELDWPS